MDNATRKELLYKARAVGYPGSILDVFANYDQGKDLIGEFQQQQQMQQQMQMSDIAAQQSGLEQPQQQMQQPQQQGPQMPVVPSSPTPTPKFDLPQAPAPIGVQSQDAPMGIVSGQSGPNQGRAIFKEGGFKEKNPPTEPIYVYSKKDPAYQKYLKQKAYYDKQKAIYEMPGPGYSGDKSSYDDFVELAYRNAEYYKEKFDPEIGIQYVHERQPDNRAYVFRKPTPVILEEESNPKAIDVKPLSTPSLVDLKSVITKLPIPQTNKQRVIINTPQGDKIRVQDAKTKRFINWEDEKGLPSDVENPTGTPNDFKFATGGFTGDPIKGSTPAPTFGGNKPQFLQQPGPTKENLKQFNNTSKYKIIDLKAPRTGESVEPGNLSQDQQSSSPIGSLIEFADPTGIMSHDDAKKAYHAWKASGNAIPTFDQGLSMFSAIPALGKYGKFSYLAGTGADGMKALYKSFPWQQALNAWEMQSEGQEDYSKKTGGFKEKKCYTCVGRKHRV
jgi:hypothetical protein